MRQGLSALVSAGITSAAHYSYNFLAGMVGSPVDAAQARNKENA
jgi:hypothetical protein